MATTNFIVRHRPNRIGILVRPDMMDDLENAAALCCLIWGGIRNPIIPVNSKSDDAADELVRRFQVDALLSVADGDAIKQFMERHPLMRHPRMSGGALDTGDPDCRGADALWKPDTYVAGRRLPWRFN
jgi:hypothetical protein